MSQGRATIFTEEEDQFFRDNYLYIPLATMGHMLGFGENVVKRRLHKLGLVRPPEVIQYHRELSQIKKGNVPRNKGKKITEYMSAEAIQRLRPTMFKKGQKSRNELPDGTIVTRTVKGGKREMFIRLGKNNWQELQKYNWTNVNGPIPEGHVLRSIDGNMLNCDPSNWKVIPRAEHARRNSGVLNLPDKIVAGYISGYKNQGLRDAILSNHKDLIEVKRAHILLNRKVKNIKNKQHA